jgi:hypothetical protein
MEVCGNRRKVVGYGTSGFISNAVVPPASARGGVPFPIEVFFVGRHGGL